MAAEYKIEDIELIENDVNIAFNLLEYLFLEICENAPTSEMKENPEAYRVRQLSWNNCADSLQAIAKGAVSLFEEIKTEIHSVVEDVNRKFEEEHKQCQATS